MASSYSGFLHAFVMLRLKSKFVCLQKPTLRYSSISVNRRDKKLVASLLVPESMCMFSFSCLSHSLANWMIVVF